MSTPTGSTSTWEDRRAMFQRGKELHEPGKPIQPRRESITDKLTTTLSGTSSGSGSGFGKAGSPVSAAAGSGLPSPTKERRRSSAASSGGLFATLTHHKRGSIDYSERRSSHEEQEAKSGAFSGWFNSSFRGMQKVKDDAMKAGMTENQANKVVAEKRGVME